MWLVEGGDRATTLTKQGGLKCSSDQPIFTQPGGVNMDIGKAFSYVFEDENWIVKILIGGLFVFLSPLLIGIPFLLGYVVETVQNVMRDEPRPLPEWSDLGDKFVKGLILTVVAIVYMLPVILLACLLGIVSLAVGDRGREGVTAVTLSVQCLSSLWGLLAAIVFPAAVIRYADSGEFSAAFRFGEIFSLITANIGNYIVAILVGWVASIIAGFGTILCFVGVLFTTFWAYLIAAHLWGQVGRQALPTAV